MLMMRNVWGTLYKTADAHDAGPVRATGREGKLLMLMMLSVWGTLCKRGSC